MIAITLGEPAGIGPELVARLASENALPKDCVVIGDAQWLKQCADSLDLSLGELNIEHTPLRAAAKTGQLNPANATYVLATLDAAARGCLDGRYRATVSCPIHKGVINEAGIPFSGHTEYFAQLSHTPRVVMMLLNPRMRVALATTHVPLREVAGLIRSEALSETLEILLRDLRTRFDLSRPRVSVCGLNPHAGENGHLGDEEINIIAPVIESFKQRGEQIDGPWPADTLFTPARLSACDAVLAMYHDQGLAPLKYAGFGESVNITLGLPFVRTSVDHGTALDIAGRGQADPGSLKAAIQLAQHCSANHAR